jgi:hypothetical protein
MIAASSAAASAYADVIAAEAKAIAKIAMRCR